MLVILFGAAGLTFGRERLKVEVRLREALAERNASLEHSNQSLEEFAYVASHDLQEPLRAISGFTQLLQDRYAGKLDAEADEFMGFIVDGTRRMQHLIDDVLQYSRVTTHGRPLVPVDLMAVTRRAVQNLQASLAAIVGGDRLRRPARSRRRRNAAHSTRAEPDCQRHKI